MPDREGYTFTFQHGWALNSLFFMPLKKELENIFGEECKYNLLERGYFSEYPDVSIDTSEKTQVVICHSLGLHLLPKTLLNADFFVLLGCFTSFHPEERVKQIRSQKIIRRMLSKLLLDCDSVIFDFHNLCFNSTSDPSSDELSASIMNDPESWNIALLRKDLSMLDGNTFDTGSINRRSKALILQGEKDMVVSEEKANQLLTKLPDSKFEIISGGSHGFALQSPGEVALSIKNFLAANQQNTVTHEPVLDYSASSTVEIR